MSFKQFLYDNASWVVPLSITFLFSVLNIYMAILNYKNAKASKQLQQESMRCQLLDARLKIYNEIQKILLDFKTNGLLNEEHPKKLHDIMAKCLYVYGKDVFNIVLSLEAIYTLLIESHFEMRNYEDNKIIEEYENAKQRHQQYINDFYDKMHEFNILAEKYLDFSEYVKAVKK